MTTENFQPDLDGFKNDPFGFASAALLQWRVNLAQAGFFVDPASPATQLDLKTPHLWLCQSQALTEAAVALIKASPSFMPLPPDMRPIADRQFRGAALMLVGYSLEVGLKAMLLISKGPQQYTDEERKLKNHRLRELADFIPGLDDKEKAILDGLTEFIYWAGRYPDPGGGKTTGVEQIFELAETHKITLKDVLLLATKIQMHTKHVVDEVYPAE